MTSRSVLVSDRAVIGPQGQARVDDLSEFVDPSPWSGDYAVFNALIYGEPGEGKTPLLGSVAEVSEMMPALLIDCDSGTLSIRKVTDLPTIHLVSLARKRGVTPWKALEQVYAWLRFGDHPYVTCMLDGGTDLQRFCELDSIMVGQDAKDNVGKDHDDELAELADYRRIQERTARTYMRFRDIATKDGRRLNFIATAHEGARKDDLTGAMTVQPLFLGKGTVLVQSKFDIIARLTHDNSKPPRQLLVPSLEGRTRGRDRSFSLGSQIENPTMRKIFDLIHNKPD